MSVGQFLNRKYLNRECLNRNNKRWRYKNSAKSLLNDLTLLYEQMLGKYYLRMVINEFLHRFAELGSS